MNIGTSEHSKIIVTDPDTIEKSNLSRQLLFRSQHVGMMKSNVAVEVIKMHNMHITPYQFMLSNENNLLTEQVFKKIIKTSGLQMIDS